MTTPPEVRPVVRQRVAQRRRRRRRVTILQSVVTLLAVVALCAMSWLGYRYVLRITGGADEIVTDPAAPGYVAEVRSTAVSLVAVTGDGDELISVLIVVDDAGAAGITAVPLTPLTTLQPFEESPALPAEAVFAEGGVDVLALRLGADLGFGVTETMVVPGARLVELAEQVGPLTVPLADDVLEGDWELDRSETSLRFGAGDLVLEPELVDDFLAFNGYREPDPNRALRSGALWSSLISLLRESGAVTPGAEGGEPVAGATSGALDDEERFARLITEMVTEQVSFSNVPRSPITLETEPPVTIYRIDTDAMREWVASHVPFPVSAFPGQFATAAVLNGTEVEGAVVGVASRIVAAGVQIELTGNADGFDVSTSRVEYLRAEAKAAAEDVATALGVVATQVDSGRNDVDVTVVVGKDLLS